MSDNADPGNEAERISAWQCTGCGRIEGPQPCVGVCQDERSRFVPADAYDAALARLREAEARLAALESLARRMALSTPRDGEWEKSYRALQDEARRADAARARARADATRRAVKSAERTPDVERRPPGAQALAAAIAWASSNLATMQRLRPLRLAQ